MKTIIISIVTILSVFLTNNIEAQSSNYVGKWETVTPVSFYNNLVLKIKISGTDNPNYLIITNNDTPKKKIGSKYDEDMDRLYTNVKGHQIYFIYHPTTDMLEAFKINGTSICLLTRFN